MSTAPDRLKSLARCLVALIVLVPALARADASVPAGAAPATPDPDAYAPLLPLPAGFVPGALSARSGSPPAAPCTQLPPAGECEWHRDHTGERSPASVTVRLLAQPPQSAPAPRPSLLDWARRSWTFIHGSPKDFPRALRKGILRIWQRDGLYAMETVQSFSCRECDPIWRAQRLEERGGHVFHVNIAVYGFPQSDDIADLRRAFLDGPLGAPR